MTAPLPFATDLAPVTREDWLKLVDGVLKGAPYDKRLVTRTAEGLALDALPVRKANAQPVAGRAAGAPWTISARVDQPDPAAANAQAIEDLEGGASGLTLVFASSPAAHGFGLPGGAPLGHILGGVMLDLIGVRLESGRFRGRENALAYADLVAERDLDPAALDVSFGLDPLADLAAVGAAPMPWAMLSHRVAETAALLKARGFSGPLLRADGAVHHAAGATDAQELAAVLAAAVAYLRALETGGFPLEEAARRIDVALTADVNQIATIAKFRAIRLLWGAVLREAGLPETPLKVHATTAWRSLTRRDPYVNLLRGTIAAFAAGVGGADSLTVLPFTQALGLPDAQARRLARNTQLILLEESQLHRVADPSAGAGAVEAHTDGLAGAAWELFRAIERQGGLADALESGWWPGEIAAARDRRARDIATRKEPLTGTSEFPILGQGVPEVLAPVPARENPPTDKALAPHRLAEPFEALRDAAEQAGNPHVFLATLGPIAAFTARAGFAKALFEAGGLGVTVTDGYAGLDDVVAAFAVSGTPVACLASSDEIYAADATAAATALKNAGAAQVWLAGRGGEHEAAWRAAGVDGFISAGCDVLAALTEAHAALRIGGR
ncbi:methylmalonyl-CoA mutase family protein [Azorhizobium doebereinerae]|uniref:methylmalonyl-CoA mutase family protein n=1 Tax=Azorhizobium doebereinerae TaxID=281091 RepID=UPI0004035256|nr:methylmalonyl-CoA mutase family protein [Azorhizobium doebereinerae]